MQHLEGSSTDGVEHGVHHGHVLRGTHGPELEAVPAVREGGGAVAVLRGHRQSQRPNLHLGLGLGLGLGSGLWLGLRLLGLGLGGTTSLCVSRVVRRGIALHVPLQVVSHLLA